MAKVTIVLEDIGNGKVRCEATPNFSTMIKIDQSGAGLTAAQGYALFALNEIRKESKKNTGGVKKLWLPGVRNS